ncbi:MAG: Asp23/Gls24 family envelope stress response protein [Clostridia bacterium]|nr:Asp23/Gls24 family envelope stress response protein [Clostridia bacterium]MCI2001014.1 Asp23/Gls24 family envelope stress response protein [Clostridia bacterium]MCI2015613.1 Asp23/Gls24 family envelope stress response protein [Clostridia bacterium]
MSAVIENKFGVISIEDEVIARVAGCTAMECYGIVGMAAKNMKDGIFQLLKVDSLTKGINVDVDMNKVSIDFHIIVEYGTNITAIAENIVSTVKFRIEECFALTIEKINVFVEGVRVDS